MLGGCDGTDKAVCRALLDAVSSLLPVALGLSTTREAQGRCTTNFGT